MIEGTAAVTKLDSAELLPRSSIVDADEDNQHSSIPASRLAFLSTPPILDHLRGSRSIHLDPPCMRQQRYRCSEQCSEDSHQPKPNPHGLHEMQRHDRSHQQRRRNQNAYQADYECYSFDWIVVHRAPRSWCLSLYPKSVSKTSMHQRRHSIRLILTPKCDHIFFVVEKTKTASPQYRRPSSKPSFESIEW